MLFYVVLTSYQWMVCPLGLISYVFLVARQWVPSHAWVFMRACVPWGRNIWQTVPINIPHSFDLYLPFEFMAHVQDVLAALGVTYIYSMRDLVLRDRRYKILPNHNVNHTRFCWKKLAKVGFICSLPSQDSCLSNYLRPVPSPTLGFPFRFSPPNLLGTLSNSRNHQWIHEQTMKQNWPAQRLTLVSFLSHRNAISAIHPFISILAFVSVAL